MKRIRTKKRKVIKEPFVKDNFIQNCGIFDYEFQVFVGMTKEQVIKKMKKFQQTEQLVVMIESSDFNEFGGMVVEDEHKKRALILPKYKPSWTYVHFLMHELHHMTLMLARQKGFAFELESCAYLFCYLFDEIRHRLDKKS